MRKALGIVIILFSIIVSTLFIKHSFTEDWKYKVDPEFDYYDNKITITKYDVSHEDTRELYALEDSEIDLLMVLSIGLSILSISYVLVTLTKDKKNGNLDILNQENDLLRKQIENNELKQRLKGVSTTDIGTTKSDQNSDSAQIDHHTTEERNLVLCPKCATVNDTKYTFCSQCGHSLAITPESKTKSKGKYISGVLIALIWSTILSIITIIFYVIKDMADVDKIANNAVQGILARPIVVLLIALIFSSFFSSKDNKINKFNTSTKYLMGILTIGEVGRWFVILGA